MPETGPARKRATPQRKSQQTTADQNVAKKQTSYHDAATVQDRIRKWQTEDVVGAVDPDVLSVKSQARSEACRTPVRLHPSAAELAKEKEAQSTPRRRSTKWVQAENRAWVKQRRSMRQSTRISPKQPSSQTEPVVEDPAKEKTPPSEYLRSESQRTRNINSSRAEREERRRRRREARARANGGGALVDDGIRVYNKSRSHFGSETGGSTPARSVKDDGPESVLPQDDSPQFKSQLSFRHDGPLPGEQDDQLNEDGSPKQPTKYAQTLGKPPAESDRLEPPKSRKRGILSKTKEILTGGNDAPEGPSNRIPSIQAWLEEQPDMPDPFVDGKEKTPSPGRNVPKPSKHRSHRKKDQVEPAIAEVDDPNKIWDSLNPVQQREARRASRREHRNASSRQERDSETSNPKRRLFSFEVCDEPSKGEDHIAPPPDYADHQNQAPPDTRTSARKTRKSTRDTPSTAAVAAAEPLEQPTVSALNRESSIQPDRDITPRKQKASARLLNEVIVESAESHQNDAALGEDRPASRELKRKLTTHEDLLSVLSQPRARRSTRSVRSLRKPEGPSNEMLIREALETMRQEELRYTRELRTLVDGVTPVLLQSLLSKADATATAGLFSENKNNDASFTRPIIDMGVALQRLKNMHGRIPLQENNLESLLTWAVTAHKSYSDYVKSWRLGFQGVIVNLAPLDPTQMTAEEMLSRDPDGDVVDDQGQKADVAYLQKRPLIRIKRMAKLFTTIRDASPGHEKALKVAELYAALTEVAKQRHSEEQGRLEDEAAANIDITRTRDIKTMAPLEIVEVDKKRKVRARDMFNLSLYHSNGQRLDCRIEIVLRDDPTPGTGGDILICQVEEEAKWLLFQPIHLSKVSSRREKSESDLIVMVKGVAGISQGWHEILALRAEDPAAVTEWLHMLGSNPLPPKLNHNPSWNMAAEPPAQPPIQPEIQGTMPADVPEVPRVSLSAGALAALPSDVDVPIGEPSVVLRRRRPKATTESTASEQKQPERQTKLSMGGGLQQRNVPEHYQHAMNLPQQRHHKPSLRSSEQSTVSADSAKVPTTSQASPRPSSSSAPSSSSVPNRPMPSRQVPLVPRPRYSPQKLAQPSSIGTTSTSTYFIGSDLASQQASEVQAETDKLVQEIENAQHSWEQEPPLMSGGLATASPADIQRERSRTRDETPEDNVESESEPRRPPVTRPRKHSRVRSFSSTPLTDTIKEQWATLSGFRKKQQSTPNTPERKPASPELVTDDLPTPRPISGRDQSPIMSPASLERPPPPPAHRSVYSITGSPRQSMTSLPDSPRPRSQQQPDTMSPLKQGYHASSSDDSDSDSDSDETDATSDMSEDDLHSELKDQATPLVQVSQGNRRSSYGPARPLPSVPSAGTKTLDPSDSASNGPYRRAPPPSSFPANKKKRSIAMVCSWSDRGVWEPIQEDECSIVISPGLVQAFPMSAAHSQPMAGADWEADGDEQSTSFAEQQPLVEFELTPVVPLRKGTALDITIRSPPTPNSTIRATNNVMFRSRTVQECEKLYQLINWARCNNPTYAQLARSRAREPTVSFATDVQQSKSRSWFSFGSKEKSSYRASSRPPTSIADSAASGASTNSAFSALRKFGQNSPFSLKRSSIMRKPGLSSAGGGSLYSSSNGGSGSGTSTPVPASQAGFIPGPDGPNVPATSAEAANGGGMVNNMKVRLFVRQGSKWEALGQSFLTVLPAAINTNTPDSRPGSSGTSTPPQRISRAPSAMPPPRTSHLRLPSSSNTPHRIHGDGREKRILITNMKKKDVVLLDVILGESCFEKVMQTGIAVNVWKEDEDIKGIGGVMTGRSRMYMIQFRTSTEASWVFNMCGTYRYGSGGQP
ncbi:hypothetical protein OHC33_006440 [Knufia fluminis]|uniref:Uncharacterized protein n=1 Tax=Knufia fluminis TaxID=191047 RepID=A0AAN8I369_9EURO|nr:hypothetical protein OHC33_006440 [Knufia fluminis]